MSTSQFSRLEYFGPRILNAIQTLQHKEAPKTVDDLIIVVKKTFDTFPASKSNRIFLSLQQCMIQIMKNRGANSYKIQHMNKKSLESKRKQPLRLPCSPKLIEDVTEWLNLCENN